MDFAKKQDRGPPEWRAVFDNADSAIRAWRSVLDASSKQGGEEDQDPACCNHPYSHSIAPHGSAAHVVHHAIEPAHSVDDAVETLASSE